MRTSALVNCTATHTPRMVPTPTERTFGIRLKPSPCAFQLGEIVLAPAVLSLGHVHAKVVEFGTREDQPGVWVLLRTLQQREPGALLRESDLQAVGSQVEVAEAA